MGSTKEHTPTISTEASFEAMLLRSDPRAALTAEIGDQLRAFLPIRSLDELKERLVKSPLTVGGQALPSGAIEAYLPARLFPVADEADLAVKVSAAVRAALTLLAAPDGGGPTVRPVPDQVLAAVHGEPSGAAPTGFLEGPSLFGGEGAPAGPRVAESVWAVTLLLSDCDTGNLLPWSWLTDGTTTYQFDANAQFIAVLDSGYENYSVLVMRDGYINRLVVLTQSTMAGTTQQICLNAAS